MLNMTHVFKRLSKYCLVNIKKCLPGTFSYETETSKTGRFSSSQNTVLRQNNKHIQNLEQVPMI